MWKAFVLILCVTLGSASCPEKCRCPVEVATCAAGVGVMLDTCGCCEVCARQLFEDCSKTQPCDHARGLECNFGGGFGSAKGICRAKSDGRTCDYNNKIYQNGEIFRPNCKHQCTCMDSAVSCVSLCPRELLLPKLACVKPGRVTVAGRCCERLVCTEKVKPQSSGGKKHRKKESKDRASEDDLTNKNELAPEWREESEPLAAFGSHPVGHKVAIGEKCVSQTTAWSPCSKSCGVGVSSRVNNSNRQCKPKTETRICEVRPCNQKTKGQKCSHVEKAGRPVKLSYDGCRSLKRFQPRHCGSCSDGRCCAPHQTQTVPVHFRCRNGATFRTMVMKIKSCMCTLNCSGSDGKMENNLYTLNKHMH
ncbi:CYR61-like [Solea senegalensis]|uniref:CCN family member 1 n=1 Tax=Solea senegalensis TaxID=28829 RepID=A0AAV6PAP4_SOLSE|nr:CCN family member 1-like [Solea senegalensis]KAG7454142.1 CYR61-like [Solea senegalensis]